MERLARLSELDPSNDDDSRDLLLARHNLPRSNHVFDQSYPRNWFSGAHAMMAASFVLEVDDNTSNPTHDQQHLRYPSHLGIYGLALMNHK